MLHHHLNLITVQTKESTTPKRKMLTKKKNEIDARSQKTLTSWTWYHHFCNEYFIWFYVRLFCSFLFNFQQNVIRTNFIRNRIFHRQHTANLLRNIISYRWRNWAQCKEESMKLGYISRHKGQLSQFMWEHAFMQLKRPTERLRSTTCDINEFILYSATMLKLLAVHIHIKVHDFRLFNFSFFSLLRLELHSLGVLVITYYFLPPFFEKKKKKLQLFGRIKSNRISYRGELLYIYYVLDKWACFSLVVIWTLCLS